MSGGLIAGEVSGQRVDRAHLAALSPTRLKAKTTMTREPAVIKKKLGMTVTYLDALESKIPQVEAGGCNTEAQE